MDLVAGYRHVHLHPSIVDAFCFIYDGVMYQCLALIFGWGRSALVFCRFLKTFVQLLRFKGCLVLWYLDEVLISSGKEGSVRSCKEASIWIQDIMDQLGLKRHATKGVWDGRATKLDRLGFTVDTKEMMLSVTEGKQERMRKMAKNLLGQERFGKGLVSAQFLTSFCGKEVLSPSQFLLRGSTQGRFIRQYYLRRGSNEVERSGLGRSRKMTFASGEN